MKQATPFFFHWERIVDDEIRKPLVEIRKSCGSREQTVRFLKKWTEEEIRRLLELEPIAEPCGPTIFALTPLDLELNSTTQLRQTVRCAIVKVLEYMGTHRFVADFIAEDRSVAWRAMGRPEYETVLEDHRPASAATIGRCETPGRAGSPGR